MKRKLLSLLLCISFVLALVPAAALAAEADPLQPADLYYSLSGETSSGEKPDITLHKTAVDNGDGTYTVTLTAEAKEKVTIKDTEVAFVLDASGSMNWCTQNDLKKGWDGIYYDPNNKAHYHGWDRNDVPYCSIMGKTIDGVTVTSRWAQATSAIHTVEQNLAEDVTKHYVYFSDRANDATDSSYTGISPKGSTHLSDGVKAGIARLTDSTKKHVLIIVADGESDDGYPADEVQAFKDAGGTVYTVGFTFSSDKFEALASKGGNYTANNADELKVAMDEITTKVAGLISDPMGDGVELVPGSVKVSGEGYENSEQWTSEDGRTIYWTNKDGLNNKVTLTYTVKLTDATVEAAKENGLDVPLNKNATLNFDGADGAIQVPFPVPVAHVDRELKNFTLTYVSNGGTEYAAETYKEGTEVAIDKAPTREGYIFKGWYSDEALTQAVSKVTMDSDKTVYAKWEKEIKNFTLTYVSNGGTEYAAETYKEGTEVTIDKAPIREGYIFKGWYSDEALTQAVSKVTMDSDKTVYAKWEKEIKNFTLTYVSNGGTEFDPETYKEGTEVPLSKIPTRAGFSFLGWYADAALTQLVTKVTMDSDKTVYAGWKEDETPVLEKGDHSAYIIGYKDGYVRPNRNISRAEVATIFFRLLTDEAREKYWSSTNNYSDVKDTDWCNNAISTLSNMGILKGDKDGRFRPNDPVTRAEFAAIAARFSDGAADDYADFSDVPNDYWASKEIAKAAKLGWIKGYTDGTFRPKNNITRAEVMTLVNRVLERGVDEDGLAEDAIQWADNKPGDWYYYDVQEATNSHEYARTDKPIDGQSFCYEEWIKLKENRNWAELETIWKNLYEK